MKHEKKSWCFSVVFVDNKSLKLWKVLESLAVVYNYVTSSWITDYIEGINFRITKLSG